MDSREQHGAERGLGLAGAFGVLPELSALPSLSELPELPNLPEFPEPPEGVPEGDADESPVLSKSLPQVPPEASRNLLESASGILADVSPQHSFGSEDDEEDGEDDAQGEVQVAEHVLDLVALDVDDDDLDDDDLEEEKAQPTATRYVGESLLQEENVDDDDDEGQSPLLVPPRDIGESFPLDGSTEKEPEPGPSPATVLEATAPGCSEQSSPEDDDVDEEDEPQGNFGEPSLQEENLDEVVRYEEDLHEMEEPPPSPLQVAPEQTEGEDDLLEGEEDSPQPVVPKHIGESSPEDEDIDDEEEEVPTDAALQQIEAIGECPETVVDDATVAVREGGAECAECYKGLGRRLQPFVQHAVSFDPDDPDQMRERVAAFDRFRYENVEVQTAVSLGGKESVGSLFCRICRDTDDSNKEPVVSPCLCRGSVARVHMSCLERWLAESDSSCCELCGHQYCTVRTPSYSVLASIPAWVLNTGGTDLFFDLVAFVIFTPVALFGTHLGVNTEDNPYFQVTLMAAIDLVYSAWLFMRFHYHTIRWHSWWRRKSTVKVILDSDKPKKQIPDS